MSVLTTKQKESYIWDDSYDSSNEGSSVESKNFIVFVVSHGFFDELRVSDAGNTCTIVDLDNGDEANLQDAYHQLYDEIKLMK